MDEQHLLTTPENVTVSYELAGFGSRLAAGLLDTFIIVAIELGLLLASFIIPPALMVLSPSMEVPPWLYALGAALWVLLGFALLLACPIVFEIAWSGQTPGKRIANIRMIRQDGGPVTASAVIVRNLMRLADFLPAYYIIGIVTMLIDKKARRLGDLAAGTICVKEAQRLDAQHLVAERAFHSDAEAPADPRLGNVSLLTREDRYLLREYLARKQQMEPAARRQLADRVANRLASRLAIELGDWPTDDFLLALGNAMQRQAGSRVP